MAMESRLPLDKLRHLKLLVAEWHLCKSCLRKELEFLVGHLSHGCKVFKPEKRFLQGLIGRSLAGPKRHHFISISTLSSEEVVPGKGGGSNIGGSTGMGPTVGRCHCFVQQ